MKHPIFILTTVFCYQLFAQNVQVDSQTYTPQQLIENILIGSNCITNVRVTNVVGGNFGGTDQSYGYFDATGTNFPFQSGVVLSTGRLRNVQGPNNSLSDDNAPNWGGDNDLENILNEHNTLNATVIEFEFTATANLISFRYIFASEEYQENNPNTCIYSDLFGFLIRNTNDTQYQNIALIPNTQTPVKVTTVHPAIPNGCPQQNEAYFGSWNNSNAPINFNGQTAVLTAVANTIPYETYHVKLVIADEQNHRYDSAVFLEARSFQLRTDLGVDRLISTNNPLCENETLTLDATQFEATNYKWFKNGLEIFSETNHNYTVRDEGVYEVEVKLQNSCFSYGRINVESLQNPLVFNSSITQCDFNQDGITLYNLYDAEQTVTNNNNSIFIDTFFTSIEDAQEGTNHITTPFSFQNTLAQQVVYARVSNQGGCFSIAEITLLTSNNIVTLPTFETCDNQTIDGISDFNTADLITHVNPFVPNGSVITCFLNRENALNNIDELTGTFTNSIPNLDTIFVKIETNGTCYSITELELRVLFTPTLLPNESIFYCLNTFPQTIPIDAGILNDSIDNYTYQWFLNNQATSHNTSTIHINEIGTYTVIATHTNGCETARNITVNASRLATIEDIIIVEASHNNTVSVMVSGDGSYQFAIDTLVFKDDGVFTNVSAGFHTIYINDINGCGIIQKEIAVLGFPKFFTPNGDGFNDTWIPFGVNQEFNSNLIIKIFNRYGKLLKTMNPQEIGWNGTFNGVKLPTDDYWFKLLLEDGREYSGHFTLKR